MNCNKCGEELFNNTSQYTKFCRDCGKIIINIDKLNPVKQIEKTTTVNNNPTYLYNTQTDNQPLPEYLPYNNNDNSTKFILFSVLAILFIVVVAIVYVSRYNSPKEESTLTETKEVITDSTAVTVENTENENFVIVDSVNANVTVNNTQPTNSNYYTDEYFTEKIKQYYEAEKSRNYDNLYNNFLYSVTKYYDVPNPNYDELKKRFEYLWNITSDVNNTIKSFNINRYENYTQIFVTLDYSYFGLKKQEYQTVYDSNIIFNFDSNGNIIGIYENK